ncbi:Uncharacterized protein YKL098W [Sugiyamaella lignohabitans]|uniref:Uncharacterized protein YKL098W n=1 Tax=Sugiyamaella lignohabitans TaxID=796027 RepID=A0A167EDQ4_9ASCO|nr:Uncharacterized protein YKL098W [Sugiyamaella lignohabitans]ANB13943.1 Uncharacterized protein YKL098W [Sugiyamaella lignohabitans]
MVGSFASLCEQVSVEYENFDVNVLIALVVAAVGRRHLVIQSKRVSATREVLQTLARDVLGFREDRATVVVHCNADTTWHQLAKSILVNGNKFSHETECEIAGSGSPNLFGDGNGSGNVNNEESVKREGVNGSPNINDEGSVHPNVSVPTFLIIENLDKTAKLVQTMMISTLVERKLVVNKKSYPLPEDFVLVIIGHGHNLVPHLRDYMLLEHVVETDDDHGLNADQPAHTGQMSSAVGAGINSDNVGGGSANVSAGGSGNGSTSATAGTGNGIGGIGISTGSTESVNTPLTDIDRRGMSDPQLVQPVTRASESNSVLTPKGYYSGGGEDDSYRRHSETAIVNATTQQGSGLYPGKHDLSALTKSNTNISNKSTSSFGVGVVSRRPTLPDFSPPPGLHSSDNADTLSFQNLLSSMADKIPLITIAANIQRYMQDIVVALRTHRLVRSGVSPQAVKDFHYLVRALSVLHDYEFVTPSIVSISARKLFPLRIQLCEPTDEPSLSYGGDIDLVTQWMNKWDEDLVIEEILANVPCAM